MPRPGRFQNLDEDLKALAQAGVQVLVSLLEPDEARRLGLEREREACEQAGLQFVSFPVRDHSTPSDPQAALQMAAALAARVRSGERVVFHCFAGIGRSATLALLTMASLGVPLPEATELLSEARGLRVPETQAQYDWIADALAQAP